MKKTGEREKIERATCSHDITYRFHDEIDELENNECLQLCRCMRCSTLLPLDLTWYDQKKDDIFYTYQYNTNMGKYTRVDIYSRRENQEMRGDGL